VVTPVLAPWNIRFSKSVVFYERMSQGASTGRSSPVRTPGEWSLVKNLSEFDGKFYQPMREQVRARGSAVGGLGARRSSQT